MDSSSGGGFQGSPGARALAYVAGRTRMPLGALHRQAIDGASPPPAPLSPPSLSPPIPSPPLPPSLLSPTLTYTHTHTHTPMSAARRPGADAPLLA